MIDPPANPVSGPAFTGQPLVAANPAQGHGNVPPALQHARPGEGSSLLQRIGRVALCIVSLGISEGLRALFKLCRAASPQETPPPRLADARQDTPPLHQTTDSQPSTGPAGQSAVAQMKELALTSLREGILPMDEILRNLRQAVQNGALDETGFREISDALHAAAGRGPQTAPPVPLGPAARLLLTSVLEQMRAGIPLDALEQSLQYDVAEGRISQPEAQRIMQEARQAPPQTGGNPPAGSQVVADPLPPPQTDGAGGTQPLPTITSAQALKQFIIDTAFGQAGQVREDGQVPDSEGKLARLFNYEGFVFRADGRPPREVARPGGLLSKNDLRDPANLQEARGLGSGKGATGQSGVSCAKMLSGAIGYHANTSGRIYIIDTRKLGGTEKAYDMEHLLLENHYKTRDESGGEVNVTNIRPEAIVGWITVPDAVIDADNDEKIPMLVADLQRNRHFGRNPVELNPSYQP